MNICYLCLGLIRNEALLISVQGGPLRSEARDFLLEMVPRVCQFLGLPNLPLLLCLEPQDKWFSLQHFAKPGGKRLSNVPVMHYSNVVRIVPSASIKRG